MGGEYETGQKKQKLKKHTFISNNVEECWKDCRCMQENFRTLSNATNAINNEQACVHTLMQRKCTNKRNEQTCKLELFLFHKILLNNPSAENAIMTLALLIAYGFCVRMWGYIYKNGFAIWWLYGGRTSQVETSMLICRC